MIPLNLIVANYMGIMQLGISIELSNYNPCLIFPIQYKLLPYLSKKKIKKSFFNVG